jgi:phosphatidate phosphatase PAH1
MSPKPLAATALEAITTGPARQKRDTIASILRLFAKGHAVVDGAYGNTATDREAYLDAQISPSKVWIVNEEGVLKNVGTGHATSYSEQAADINRLYPHVERKKKKKDEETTVLPKDNGDD